MPMPPRTLRRFGSRRHLSQLLLSGLLAMAALFAVVRDVQAQDCIEIPHFSTCADVVTGAQVPLPRSTGPILGVLLLGMGLLGGLYFKRRSVGVIR